MGKCRSFVVVVVVGWSVGTRVFAVWRVIVACLATSRTNPEGPVPALRWTTHPLVAVVVFVGRHSAGHTMVGLRIWPVSPHAFFHVNSTVPNSSPTARPRLEEADDGDGECDAGVSASTLTTVSLKRYRCASPGSNRPLASNKSNPRRRC